MTPFKEARAAVRLGALLAVFAPVQAATSPSTPVPSPPTSIAPAALETDDGDDQALRMLSRAEGLLDLGRADAAADLARAIPEDGPHASAARALHAWALFKAERHGELVELLDGELGADDDDLSSRSFDSELTFLRGAARLRAGTRNAALQDLRRLWWGEADSAWALYALRELAQGSVDRDGAYTAAERALVLKKVPQAQRRRAHDNLDVDAVLRALVHAAPKRGLLVAEARHALGVRHLDAERLDAAIAELNAAFRGCRNADFRRAVELRLGEGLRRRGAYRAAMQHFDRVAQTGTDHLANQALALAGQMAIEFRRYPDARKRFMAQLVGNPVGASRQQALWGLGWVAFRTGDHAAARQFFRTLFTESQFGPYAAQSLYWGARAAEEVGDKSTARAELEYLVASFPLDYYAFRAAKLIQVGEVHDALYPSGPLQLDEAVDYVAQLTSAGMIHRAERALARVDERLHLLGPHELRALQTAVEALERPGWVKRVRWERHSRFPDGAEARELLSKLFPERYLKIIRRAHTDRRVPFDLVVALVRQESGFNPRAASGVGAVGLMQLMPQTADELLREERKRGLSSPAELMDPELNVRLGLRYIGRMLRAFNGRVEYALAAYNAGPGAVTRWRQTHGDLPADIFVEEIPYEETRTYVRRVLAGLRTFGYVNRPAPAKTAALE